MYIKKIVLGIALLGLIAGGILVYTVYGAFFTPNTAFNNEKKGMNNNEIIGVLRSQNLPVKVAFNNQETIQDLAGRVAAQIEADSLSLLQSFTAPNFLKDNGFSANSMLSMYVPNSYEFFWNVSADTFRNKMLKEYTKFWNMGRLEKAKKIGLSSKEVVALASIVHKETVKVSERPRVAGVYLNRLRKGILLQADPTVIYASLRSTTEIKSNTSSGLMLKRSVGSR